MEKAGKERGKGLFKLALNELEEDDLEGSYYSSEGVFLQGSRRLSKLSCARVGFITDVER